MGMSLAYGHFQKCLQFGVLACYIHEPVGSIFSSELGPQSDRFFFLTTDLVGLMDGITYTHCMLPAERGLEVDNCGIVHSSMMEKFVRWMCIEKFA